MYLIGLPIVIADGEETKMRLVLWLCLGLVSMLLASSAWPQQRGSRLALLIANSEYTVAATPLPTTVTDARALADELRHSGFEVDIKLNVGKVDMQAAIDAFGNKLSPGTTVLFYFGGFGVQIDRQSYLMPANADSWRAEDVRKDGISIDTILAEFQRKGARVKIVILDAARQNPFERRFRPSRSEGLASINAPENTLALYSVIPGKLTNDRPGTSSVFISELIKEIARASNAAAASVTAEDVFNHLKVGVYRASNNEQVPWVASSLVEEFYFGTQQVSSVHPSPPPPPSPPPAPRANTPLSHAAELALIENDHFRECAACPEMVVAPEGEYTMGSSEGEADRYSNEGPQHQVKITRRFAVGKLKITRQEFETFVNETGYFAGDRCFTMEDGRAEERNDRSFRNPGFDQDGTHPVVCINWDDANAYVAWLSNKTGKFYRLLSESEWEYVARAGTKTPFWWGSTISTNDANYDGNSGYAGGPKGQYRQKTVPADMFKPNAWGLYQMSGNAFEWVEDCWNETYQYAPADDWVRLAGNCGRHVRRAGAWNTIPRMLRSAYRESRPGATRGSNMGMRVARTLAQ
jgi:formylglycine-generating enzyme required for sulfatase activity